MTAREYKARCAILKRENADWPLAMTPVPNHRWSYIEPAPAAVWRSTHFLAQLFSEAMGGQRLSINRSAIQRDGSWTENISWDELMTIKAECGFADAWAVEIFPPVGRVVNVANMRHLWIVGRDKVPFAWNL